jgi:hypothetical protein
MADFGTIDDGGQQLPQEQQVLLRQLQDLHSEVQRCKEQSACTVLRSIRCMDNHHQLYQVLHQAMNLPNQTL